MNRFFFFSRRKCLFSGANTPVYLSKLFAQNWVIRESPKIIDIRFLIAKRKHFVKLPGLRSVIFHSNCAQDGGRNKSRAPSFRSKPQFLLKARAVFACYHLINQLSVNVILQVSSRCKIHSPEHEAFSIAFARNNYKINVFRETTHVNQLELGPKNVTKPHK